MDNKYIDLNLTNEILQNINNRLYDDIEPIRVTEIPVVDGENIIDRTEIQSWSHELDTVCSNLRKINPKLRENLFGRLFGEISEKEGKKILTLSIEDLKNIGIQLYPYVSYGVLNGGSATSYADEKKNSSLNPELMKLYKNLFERSSQKAAGKPKGTTPAYTNSDGSSGSSFIELKLRALLIENLRYRLNVNPDNELFEGDSGKNSKKALFPMFQMTSVYNNGQISEALNKYKSSPILKDLIEETEIDCTDVLTGIQPMLAAFTHSNIGRPKQIFTNAWGRNGEMLPIPGGHGQNFMILSEIYRYMYNELGKKFIYIGNIDNIGNMPEPAAIALTALSGRQASFEFSYRTAVDVKGGILVRDQQGRLNCADIGPAISREEVDRQEKSGKKILFNCATGLFNLEYLIKNLDSVIKKLPMRITDQNKDAGEYSQAEQVTWEIIGMLNDPLILGVKKYERFLAAKLLIESFMTSGLMIESDAFPTNDKPELDFKTTAANLYKGLRYNLKTVYGMREAENGWRPVPVKELIEALGGRD